MNDNCKITERIIDEITENPEDKSKLLDKLGTGLKWLLIFAGISLITLSLAFGTPIGEKIANKYFPTQQ